MERKKITNFLLILAVFLLIPACNIPLNGTIPTQPGSSSNIETILTEMAVQTLAAVPAGPEPEETDTPAALPGKVLNVCIGREPESLFIYNSSSRSMWSVLEAVYDGPFDSLNGESVPVIFEDIRIDRETVPVSEGALVFNAAGEMDVLKSGAQIIPADAESLCGSENCSISWDGTSAFEMVQIKITFVLKSGLLWSDGTPLSSRDSVFSWRLDADSAVKTSKRNQQLTVAYTAVDDSQIQWTGIPGYIPQRSADVFWLPLPEHLLGSMSTAEILADESVNRAPLGWGAYQVDAWIPGERIELKRNEFYRQSEAEEIPYFDRVVYKFYGVSGDNNLAALKNGSCDVIDTTVDLSVDLEPVLEDVRDGKLAVYIQPQPVWEQLTLNLAPQDPDAVTFFSDPNVRKAAAQCIDREQLVREIFYGQAEIPGGFYPSAHLLASGDAQALPYDPEAAEALLEAAGWKDADGDPSTPRISQGITGIPDGTAFSVRLQTSSSDARRKSGEFVANALQACGIETTLSLEPLDVFYAQGPDGPLFGRKFDMALFSWSGTESFPCSLYAGDQIPAASNHWVGVNLGGFQSDAYDTACGAAQKSMLFYPENQAALAEVQRIYADELPVIPLYFDFSIAVSNLQLCGLENAIGTRSLLWNIESLSSGESACAVSQWKNIYADGE